MVRIQKNIRKIEIEKAHVTGSKEAKNAAKEPVHVVAITTAHQRQIRKGL